MYNSCARQPNPFEAQDKRESINIAVSAEVKRRRINQCPSQQDERSPPPGYNRLDCYFPENNRLFTRKKWPSRSQKTDSQGVSPLRVKASVLWTKTLFLTIDAFVGQDPGVRAEAEKQVIAELKRLKRLQAAGVGAFKEASACSQLFRSL